MESNILDIANQKGYKSTHHTSDVDHVANRHLWAQTNHIAALGPLHPAISTFQQEAETRLNSNQFPAIAHKVHTNFASGSFHPMVWATIHRPVAVLL